MRYLRGQITGLNVRSVRCQVHSDELTQEQLQNDIKDGEYTFDYWTLEDRFSVKATFTLRSPKLYDYAVSILNRPVIIGIQEGEIASLETVRGGQYCHFCMAGRFRSQYRYYGLCSKSGHDLPDSYREEGFLCGVTRIVPGCVYADHDLDYYSEYLLKDGSWIDRTICSNIGDKESEIKRTRLTYTYAAHIEKMCDLCINRVPVTAIEIMARLQHLFEQKGEIINLTGIPIIAGTEERKKR
jgi:hypothetical protein